MKCRAPMSDVTDEQQRALDAMVEQRWPSVNLDGSYWYFDHGGGLRQVRSLTVDHPGVTIDEFRERFLKATGRKWRG